MKKLIIAACAILCSLTGYSQTPTFSEGDIVLNAGIGFGSSIYTGFGYTARPTFSLSGEYGFQDDFIIDEMTLGLGAYVGISGTEYRNRALYYGSYGYKETSVTFGGRGIVHYPFVDRLDTYAGVMLGFRVRSSSTFGTYTGDYGRASSGLAGGFFAGARYYFTERFAAMGEIGYGEAYINVGVAFKI